MDQDFQSREGLRVIVEGEKIHSIHAFDTIDEDPLDCFYEATEWGPAIAQSEPPI